MRYIMLIAMLALAACGGGGGSGATAPSVPPPVSNESAGGIWTGTRPNGIEIIVFITESGDFRLVDPFGNQGFGQAIVSNTNEISADFTIVPPFDDTLVDGSDSMTCAATGTIQQRVALDWVSSCVTALGMSFGGPVSFTYNAVYDTDSSLATIAGTYDDLGDILTIDSAGVLFEQSAATGCVMNGQVSIIDADWNLYGVIVTSEMCQGILTAINGVSWDGLATLLNDGVTDTVLAVLTGDVAGKPMSLVAILPRI